MSERIILPEWQKQWDRLHDKFLGSHAALTINDGIVLIEELSEARATIAQREAMLDRLTESLDAGAATIATLEARIALLEKALADDNEAGHLAFASHERDQARIETLEKALDSAAGDLQDGFDLAAHTIAYVPPVIRKLRSAALAKPKEAQND